MENKKTTIEEQFNYFRNEVLEQIESIDIESGRTWGVSWVLDDNFDNMIRLVELYELSKKAREFLSENQELDFRERYQELIKSYIWSRARKILLEYFTLKMMTILECFHCKKEIDYDKERFELHHEDYDIELFNPLFVKFVHKRCHDEIHSKS